jgi:hypothetical protein
MATEVGAPFAAILPPYELNDWNDALVRPEAVKTCTMR